MYRPRQTARVPAVRDRSPTLSSPPPDLLLSLPAMNPPSLPCLRVPRWHSFCRFTVRSRLLRLRCDCMSVKGARRGTRNRNRVRSASSSQRRTIEISISPAVTRWCPNSGKNRSRGSSGRTIWKGEPAGSVLSEALIIEVSK